MQVSIEELLNRPNDCKFAIAFDDSKNETLKTRSYSTKQKRSKTKTILSVRVLKKSQYIGESGEQRDLNSTSWIPLHTHSIHAID